MLKSIFFKLLFFIFVPSILNAAGFKVEIFGNDNQYVVKISDVHNFTNKDEYSMQQYNRQQAKQFKSVISQLDPKLCLIITENMLENQTNCIHEFCKHSEPEKNIEESLMSLIAQDVKDLNKDIQIVNVEFRHMYTLLKYFESAITSDLKAYFIKENFKIIKKCLEDQISANYPAPLDKFVKCLDKNFANLSLTGDLQTDLKTIQNIYASNSFASKILEIKIIDQIIKAKDKKFIFVIAGGKHIFHTNQLLAALGYSRLFNFGIDISQFYHLDGNRQDQLFNNILMRQDLTLISKFFKEIEKVI